MLDSVTASRDRATDARVHRSMTVPLFCVLSLSWRASPPMRAQPTIRARPLLRFGEPPQACESSEQAGSFSLTDSSEQAGSFSLTTLATPAALHDYFNLAVTTTVVVLVMLAHTVHPRWNRPLAIVMCAYLVLDSAWLAIQPEIFGGGSAGGGALTIMGHHLAALVVALHAATWPIHTPFVCHMAVVELNTLVLTAKRTVTIGGTLVTSTLHAIFVASWVVTRLIWFPFLCVKLSLIGGYPSLARRLVCTVSLLALTVLQFVWTWNFCVPPEKQVALR